MDASTISLLESTVFKSALLLWSCGSIHKQHLRSQFYHSFPAVLLKVVILAVFTLLSGFIANIS